MAIQMKPLAATRMHPSTMHHLFAIKVLDRLPGLFKPHRYLYHCARCKWSFIVNDGRRGVLTALGDDGHPLTHDEAVARAATFAAGPCPAMRVLAEPPSHLDASNVADDRLAGKDPARSEVRPS
jgi:hypothetical protein